MCGCSSQNSTSEPEIQTSVSTAPKNEFTLKYERSISLPNELYIEIPDGFSEKSSDYINTFFSDDTASIIISSDDFNPLYDTPSTFANYAVAQYQNMLSGNDSGYSVSIEILSSEYLDIPSGQGAFLKEFEYSVVSNYGRVESHMIFYNIYMINASVGKSYIITCSSSADKYSQYREIFQNVALSLDFR